MDFLEIWLGGFIFSMAILTLLWLVSVWLKNASIIDPYWGFGFVVIGFYYYWKVGADNEQSWIALLLITLWGLRLSGYLLWRHWGKEEDYRYQQFREDYGPHRYWWISFFQVFLLQGVLMVTISVPVLGVMMPGTGPIPWLTGTGVALWAIGILFEAIGDYQLMSFKKEARPGEVLTRGLWRYTRHPNYFGDSLVWWGVGLLALGNGYWWTLIGPLIMNILLLKVSGVSLLERNLKKSKPGYEDYMKATSAFFPWFPKALD